MLEKIVFSYSRNGQPPYPGIEGDQSIGCVDKEYLNQLVTYAVDKDNKAFGRALASGLVSGTCILFQKGEHVFILEAGVFSGLTKVRREGGTKGYWVTREAAQ